MPIFQTHELEFEYVLAKDVLPTVNDGIKFVLSRKGEHKTRVREFSKVFFDIWEKADCCPHSILRISQLFEECYDSYVKYLKKSGSKNHRKRPSLAPPPIPSRKSSRISSTSTPISEVADVQTMPSLTSTPSSKSTRSHPEYHFIVREQWNNDFGNTLFDVLNKDRIPEVVKEGGCFDFQFYNDQCGPRIFFMQVQKVTAEFQEHEVRRLQREAHRYARKMSAKGNKDFESFTDIDDVTDFSGCQDYGADFEYANSYNSFQSETSIIKTRSAKKTDDHSMKSYCDKSVQVSDLSLSIPVRSNDGGKNINPKYLKAISLLMAEGMSAAEAIKSTFVVDTVVHEQFRLLPLALDKDYNNTRSKLKKLSSGFLNISQDPILDIDKPEWDDGLDIVAGNSEDNGSKEKIKYLKDKIKSKQIHYKENVSHVLPDLRTVRRNHHLMAVYVEKCIAEDLLEHGGFCIPDGTTRNKVGEMSALVLKVNGKIRALKAQRIGKGDRSTWAEVVAHILQRITTASRNEIVPIWKSISTIISDLCKVNKSLSMEISKLIGSDWVPGQLFCVLHYVLAIPESLKAIFGQYQGQIGTEKLFPETTGFEMNIDDKTIVVQILDVWMRLTSIRWHGRMWNRYNSFTSFAEKRGIRNVGHMIHANRFGEFEERCAGGVYLAETWSLWLESFTDIRNTLSCYLRTVNGLMDICIFQWAVAALVGLHVTIPFMTMILEYKVTQRELLTILPSLYSELSQYNVSFIRFDRPALTSLAPFWQAPLEKTTSPYGVDVVEALVQYTQTCDDHLMDKSLKDVTAHMATTLKRQRGDAYGFGDNPDSEEHVLKNMPLTMLDDGDATNSKAVENYFGNLDRHISRTGPQGFDKITDDLILKYGRDYITSNEWQSKENRENAEKLYQLQSKFDEKQDKLRSAGCSDPDIAAITTMNKIQRVVKQCKENHGGPILTKDELDKIISKTKKDETQLGKILDLEIRYRKFTMTKVKNDCPLFLQRKLSNDKKIKNLNLLIDSQTLSLRALATMDDLKQAIQDISGESETEVAEEEQSNDVEERVTESILSTRIAVDDTLKKEEFILGMFEDGFYPGQVVADHGNVVDVIFMTEASSASHAQKSLWKWPSVNDQHMIRKVCILKIRPNLDIMLTLSSRRCIVYKLVNLELVEKFAL